MGLIDNIREFFSGSKNTQQQTSRINEEHEKTILANRIVDLVHQIQSIDSFDSTIWNLANVSSYDLAKKKLEDLQKLNSTLESKLSRLSRESQRINPAREALEASKWTGQKPENMTDLDFDRWQRSDDGR